MRQKQIHQKLKSFASFLIILILLPYIITVFVNGVDLEVIGMGNRQYVSVKIEDKEGNAIIKSVPWEEYFIGVLAKKIPETYQKEALKAQAVLIRTSLYQQFAQSEEEGKGHLVTQDYLTSEELEEKWGAANYEKYYKKLLEVVEETENQVLYYQDTYAWVPFHQSGNGMTRSAEEVLGSKEYPYLMVKECPLDKMAEDEMHVYTMEYSEVKERCQSFLIAAEGEEEAKKAFTFEDFEIKASDSAGYVSELRIGDTICTGDQFRDALALASSAFSIQDEKGRLKITTMGNGHGLGMSQWTANEMAQEGKTYEQILQFFFEGTNLTDGGEIFEKTE